MKVWFTGLPVELQLMIAILLFFIATAIICVVVVFAWYAPQEFYLKFRLWSRRRRYGY